ncbi:MAG: hypothetical protein Q4G50_01630 [Corynebacterium sp.]|uniref:hypothetical protein n=1 Tax=Corynebacterium sp. TaxID=1720 RepID=UPI0026DF25DD|nr:hypothetical protein [Corynebacterium sp.]MDO5668681.1 hypothetical protein [Corynebacterium sp.]
MAAVPAQAAPGEQECPAVAVLAARGSGQSDFLDSTSYSPGSRWVSNGYEEENLRAFFHYVESRHPGLFHNVPVVALDDAAYPASKPIPELVPRGEEASAAQVAQRMGEILSSTPPHVIAGDAAFGFYNGMTTGIQKAVPFLDTWEEETGCAPGYLLVGYSQGAVVLTAQERKLQERGQLVGSLYLGNPLAQVGDSTVVGAPTGGNGMLSGVPVLSSEWRAASISNRLNYCASGDFACDLSWQSVTTSLSSAGGIHSDYFLEANRHDAEVADTFAEWVTGYNPNP